jgi:hypothetical protein
MAKEFLVETGNPKALDATLNQMGAALVQRGQDYLQRDGHYVMRVLGDPGFVKFACEAQGYCTVVRELDELCGEVTG